MGGWRMADGGLSQNLCHDSPWPTAQVARTEPAARWVPVPTAEDVGCRSERRVQGPAAQHKAPMTPQSPRTGRPAAQVARSFTSSFRHFLTLSVLLFLAAAASAQSLDVSATLDLTDGAARAEAYVPVTFKITNHLGGAIDRIMVTSGGPVMVDVAWPIAANATAEKVVPVYYAGGDLRLTVMPFGSFPTREMPSATVTPTVRPLAMDEALVSADRELGEDAGRFLCEQLRAKSLRVLNLPADAQAAAARCGLIDAFVVRHNKVGPASAGRAILVDLLSPGGPRAFGFPPGVEAAVQPEAYRLFAVEAWPAADLRQLWIWLGVFTLAAAVAAALIPRRRAILGAGVLVVLAAGATVFIAVAGNLRVAPVREARVFFASPTGQARLETFTSWASRGGESPQIRLSADPAVPLPLPVLPSSESLLGPRLAVHLDDAPYVTPYDRQLLIQTLAPSEQPFGALPGPFGPDALAAVANRPGAIAALLVKGNQAIDAQGRTQPLDGWAAAWSADPDPDMAYAGRSLRWWTTDRRDGDRPVILAWWHDAPAPDSDRLRLPALVVYNVP
jgi:hypothetical protein